MPVLLNPELFKKETWFAKCKNAFDFYLIDDFNTFIDDFGRFIETTYMISIAAINQKKIFVTLVIVFMGAAGVCAQSKSLLICMEPTIVSQAEYKDLLEIGPRNFEIDYSQIANINYIDSLLKLPFQSELEIVDSSFNLADSCLQFLRKGSGGGVSSYYAYSLGVVKDEKGHDVIEIFLHYRNIVPHNKEGEQKLGISFYRLIDERILQEPVIRLHTFNKTYDIPL